MQEPANFTNETLDGVIANWLSSLAPFSVRAILVVGPDHQLPLQKLVLAVYPPKILPYAQQMLQNTESELHSAEVRPLVDWIVLSGSDNGPVREWNARMNDLGYRGALLLTFELVVNRRFECYLFCELDRISRDMQAALVWSTLSVWPKIRQLTSQTRSRLSKREVQCLRLAFDGLTASETALVLGCGDRTVNFHLANAMLKLDAHNKLQAIQKACWLGVL